MSRKTSQYGIDLIKQYNQFHATPYLGPFRIWEIGYAHTRTVRAGMEVTLELADFLLSEDLDIVERAVQRIVTVPLNDNQFDALVSFTFVVGIANFERSVLVRLLNREWYDQVPAQLVRWDHIEGKVNHNLSALRRAEARLWKTPISLEKSQEQVAEQLTA